MKLFTRKEEQEPHQIRKKGGNELQMALLPNDQSTGRTQRKITRLQTIKIDPSVTGETEPQNGEQSDNSSERQQQQPVSGNTIDSRSSSLQPESYKPGKLNHLAPRFGPCYGSDQTAMSETKKKSLEHVLKKTSDESSDAAKEIYVSAVRNVEAKAREIYSDAIKCSEPEFRMMMIQDGCFFLQLALWILGTPECLQYSSSHPLFGKKPSKKDAKLWMEAMFFVGNQIPFVILEKLMAQKFFRDAIAKGKWDPPPPSSFCKNVLYDLLILWKPGPRNNRGTDSTQLPSDVLDRLYDMVIGPGSLEKKKKKKKSGIHEADIGELDLEANEEIGDGRRANRLSVNDNNRFFPSATDIDMSGIYIAKLKKGGVRGICLKSYYFWATLYLPPLPVDDDIETVFGNLKTYEINQQLEKSRREVGSYLRLMCDVVQTSKDVQLLKRKGIIQAGSTGDEDELPELLRKLSSEITTLSDDFHSLRRKIRDYSGPPWGRIRSILNVVALLTLVQTVFSVLSYFRPPK